MSLYSKLQAFPERPDIALTVVTHCVTVQSLWWQFYQKNRTSVLSYHDTNIDEVKHIYFLSNCELGALVWNCRMKSGIYLVKYCLQIWLGENFRGIFKNLMVSTKTTSKDKFHWSRWLPGAISDQTWKLSHWEIHATTRVLSLLSLRRLHCVIPSQQLRGFEPLFNM